MKTPKASLHQAHEHAQKFLSVAKDFQLGDLPTEQRHSKTIDLANLANRNPEQALEILKKIDLETLQKVKEKEAEIFALSEDIKSTLESGGKIFFYGCGATGRLALSIEHVWRLLHSGGKYANRVMGFMSGGDLALVHSIENFEDHPEYGARQVREIGFGKNDLLVSCTEGGETPSVIGATEEAARISRRAPWFLYCNPDDILKKKVERSKKIIENHKIKKISIFVGPMSLSGSTRLQATTALQLAAGFALMKCSMGSFCQITLSDFIQFVSALDYKFLVPYIKAESEAYKKGEFLLYETDIYAMSVVTDTTERAPTFSLPGFENQKEKNSQASLSYVMIRGASSALIAWKKLLLRDPRAIEWKVLSGVAGKKRLLGFDFSQKLIAKRKAKIKGAVQHTFRILKKKEHITFQFAKNTTHINIKNLHPFYEHLLIKLLLNAHSTLVMGRLGRFESNVMTWVKPSNNKLIDRSIRYVQYLLTKDGGQPPEYEKIAHQLFLQVENLKPGESVVQKTVTAIRDADRSEPTSTGGGKKGMKKTRYVFLPGPILATKL